MSISTLTLRLPKEQREALNRSANALKKTESEYIRDLLQNPQIESRFRAAQSRLPAGEGRDTPSAMRHRGRRLAWLIVGVVIGCGFGQAADSSLAVRVPPQPSDGVFDDARMFTDDQRRAAARAIAEARQDGVSVYIAAFTFVVGETIEQRAERLKEAWCGDDIGLVVVVDASTSQCTYLSHLAERDWLSSDQLRKIFADATAASVSKPTPGERLLGVVEELVPRLRSALAERRAQGRNPASLREWLVFAGVLVACGLLLAGAWVLRRLGRRARSARPDPVLFPTVAVEPRFGGVFAGGVAAEVHFRPAVMAPQPSVKP